MNSKKEKSNKKSRLEPEGVRVRLWSSLHVSLTKVSESLKAGGKGLDLCFQKNSLIAHVS